ncbi:MAG TPA: diacylglycerol kinase [Porticoccaceae bacterium]|nr:diacylglycerol kinase [Porticoccaceae bacterium]
MTMEGASQSRRGGLVKRRLFDASRYSLQGLRACFRHEEAFRTELGIAAVLTPLAFWVARNALDLVLLLGVMLLVLIVELLNSAVESVVDLHGSERRELAGRAKDQGSAAVMLSMALCVLVWGGILWERFGG